MSKKFLKDQAQELLSSELKEIKGGTSELEDITDEACTTCTYCFSTCTPGCSKKQ